MQNGARVAPSRSLSSGGSSSARPRKVVKVKVIDLYSFEVEVSKEDAGVLNQVKERVKEQGRVWWDAEANKGAGWYLQPDISSLSESNIVSHLSLSNFTGSGQLKKLIRKGIPPALRPRVWRAVSGAIKKRSTVPDSYYQDLIEAVQGKETPATRQIDHVTTPSCSFAFKFLSRKVETLDFFLSTFTICSKLYILAFPFVSSQSVAKEASPLCFCFQSICS